MRIDRSRLVAALITVGLGGGFSQKPASAQDTGATQPKPDDPSKPDQNKTDERDERSTSENTATTKFVEAFATQDWERAERSYKELVDNWPLYRKEPSYVYKYALTLYNLKSQTKKEEAKQQLQGLLEQDPDNILALFLLAQIEAEQYTPSKPQPLEDAKEHLLQAARNGFYTLRELRASKLAQFKELQDDPRFILRVLQSPTTSQEFTSVNMKNARNPFVVPRVGPLGRPDEKMVANPREIANLEARIDDLFNQIEKLIRDKEIDKLAPLFQDLNNIMSEYKKIGLEKVSASLKKWEKKLDEWKEVRLAIQLQIYITRGNESLRAMLKAKQNEKFEEVFEQFNEVKLLRDQMIHEDREEFKRNAEAIFIRAKGLNDEALKLKKIKEFNLLVTGIVVDPRPESKNRAIIIYDDPGAGGERRGRIYEENDDIRDKEDKKVPGLKVVKISEGSIRFKFEDTEFIRELKTPQ
jgi:hypothetical protein